MRSWAEEQGVSSFSPWQSVWGRWNLGEALEQREKRNIIEGKKQKDTNVTLTFNKYRGKGALPLTWYSIRLHGGLTGD